MSYENRQERFFLPVSDSKIAVPYFCFFFALAKLKTIMARMVEM